MKALLMKVTQHTSLHYGEINTWREVENRFWYHNFHFGALIILSHTPKAKQYQVTDNPLNPCNGRIKPVRHQQDPYPTLLHWLVIGILHRNRHMTCENFNQTALVACGRFTLGLIQ